MAFTTQDFQEPILNTPGNADLLQHNCLACHAELVHDQSIVSVEGAPRCVRCHADVGHGESVGIGGPMKPHETRETNRDE